MESGVSKSRHQYAPKLERVFVWLKSGFRRISGNLIAKNCQFFYVAHDVIV